MRSQFLSAIQLLCHRRSNKSSNIRWWFSETRLAPHRAGSFASEDTVTFGSDSEAQTQEDPPPQGELWHRVEVV